MFSESDKLQAKLYAQAQIDLDHLAQDARRNGYAMGIFNSIVGCLNANFLHTITQGKSD